jgi:HAD superfamily hydrolase (TIGR01662 family)
MNSNHRSSLQLKDLSALIFDLDDTLRFSDPDNVETFHKYVRELGVDPHPQRLKAALRWRQAYFSQSPEYLTDQAAARDDFRRFWHLFTRRHLRLLGVAEEQLDPFADTLIDRMREQDEWRDHVPEHVRPTLEQLKAAGYRLALLSNRRDPLHDEIERLGLSDLFEFVLAAGETGWWKPDPRIFKDLLQRLELEPQVSVYIGDNYFADIVGARAVGLQAVLIDRYHLYPNVNCPTLESIAELPALLALEGAS